MTSSSGAERAPWRGATRRRASAAAALAIALPLLAAAALFAGEATKRGRNMDITWREPDGTVRQVKGGEVRYVYYVRSHLSKPRDGVTYKDDTVEEKGLPFKGNFLSFGKCDRFDFHWSEEGAAEGPALKIHFKNVDGEVVVGSGSEIAGANHPLPPYFEFKVNGEKRRIELLPISPPALRQGKPMLLSMVCVL